MASSFRSGGCRVSGKLGRLPRPSHDERRRQIITHALKGIHTRAVEIIVVRPRSKFRRSVDRVSRRPWGLNRRRRRRVRPYGPFAQQHIYQKCDGVCEEREMKRWLVLVLGSIITIGLIGTGSAAASGTGS